MSIKNKSLKELIEQDKKNRESFMEGIKVLRVHLLTKICRKISRKYRRD